MRSKYTNSARNTSFVVGQYLRILSKYASRDIVGTLRAWNVSVAAGVVSATLAAVVRRGHSTVCGCFKVGAWCSAVGEDGGEGRGESESFVAAICVRSDARRRRRSGAGYEWMSTAAAGVGGRDCGCGCGCGRVRVWTWTCGREGAADDDDVVGVCWARADVGADVDGLRYEEDDEEDTEDDEDDDEEGKRWGRTMSGLYACATASMARTKVSPKNQSVAV